MTEEPGGTGSRLSTLANPFTQAEVAEMTLVPDSSRPRETSRSSDQQCFIRDEDSFIDDGDEPSFVTDQLTRAHLLRLAGVAGGAAVAAASGLGLRTPTALAAPAVVRGGVLQFATSDHYAPQAMDPIKAINFGVLQGLIREGLAIYDPNLIARPNLASWTANARFTRYTLSLRRGVTFHDGKPFTSADVQWLILRHLDPANGSSVQTRLAGSLDAAGVDVVDSQTVTLTLKQPDSEIMGAFAQLRTWVVPAGTTDFDAGNGTGPFRLKSNEPGKGFEVVANRDYWQPGIPYLDGVRGVQIAEPSTKTQSVIAGASHLTEIDYQSSRLARNRQDVKVTIARDIHLLNVAMDQTRAPFRDPRVREAMKRSLDRQKLIRIAFSGFGSVAADAPLPQSDPRFPRALRARTRRDLARARALMKAAGHPNGLSLTLDSPSETLHSTFALAFAASLQGSPFRVTVKQSPESIYWDKFWLKSPFFVSNWNRRTPLESLSQMFASSAVWNEPKFKSAKLDRLIRQAYASQGAAQAKLIAEAMALIAANSGDIIPAYRHKLFASKRGVQGILPTAQHVLDFRKTWLSS